LINFFDLLTHTLDYRSLKVVGNNTFWFCYTTQSWTWSWLPRAWSRSLIA